MNPTVNFVLHPLVQPIVIALAAGALAYVLSRWSALACKCIALAAGAWVLVAAIQIPLDQSAKWQWVALTKDVTLTVELSSTTLGMVVAVGAAAFALLVTIYSFRERAGTYWEGKFYAFVIWALGGACIVAMAGNLLVLLVGWEIVTLILFLMVNQGRGEARTGAAKAYGVLGFADACLLLAIILLASMEGGTGNLSFSNVRTDVGQMGAMGYAVYALILVAALAKAGAIPLHTWIPAIAQDAPAPVMAYLPAALDKLLGIYLLAVLSLRMFRPDWTLQVIMMIIGAVTILAAVLMAMVQHNLKRLLSFHAVSQVGYMVLGIGTGTTVGIIGGLFHMLNHAIYKSNLFLMSGAVRRASGTDEIEQLGGLARAWPVTLACALISALAISGIPPLNGFASKWLIYQGALQVSDTNQAMAIFLVVVAVFGSALTLASFVKVIYSAFLSPAPRGQEHQRPRARESFFMAAPMVVLAAACVLFGIWPHLGIQLFSPAAKGAAGEISATGMAISTGDLGFWSPTQATMLTVIGLLLGLVFIWVVTIGKRVRIVRPFLAGEVPAADDDRFRFPGTHFYRTIAQLPLVGPLLDHGERGAMDPYHWAARHGNTFVQFVRSLHTGLISLYVAWCFAGLAAILVYLLVTGR